MTSTDKALVRDYTGPDSSYCAEVYCWSTSKDRLALVPLTPKQAIDIGLELIVRGRRALR